MMTGVKERAESRIETMEVGQERRYESLRNSVGLNLGESKDEVDRNMNSLEDRMNRRMDRQVKMLEDATERATRVYDDSVTGTFNSVCRRLKEADVERGTLRSEVRHLTDVLEDTAVERRSLLAQVKHLTDELGDMRRQPVVKSKCVGTGVAPDIEIQLEKVHLRSGEMLHQESDRQRVQQSASGCQVDRTHREQSSAVQQLIEDEEYGSLLKVIQTRTDQGDAEMLGVSGRGKSPGRHGSPRRNGSLGRQGSPRRDGSLGQHGSSQRNGSIGCRRSPVQSGMSNRRQVSVQASEKRGGDGRSPDRNRSNGRDRSRCRDVPANRHGSSGSHRGRVSRERFRRDDSGSDNDEGRDDFQRGRGHDHVRRSRTGSHRRGDVLSGRSSSGSRSRSDDSRGGKGYRHGGGGGYRSFPPGKVPMYNGKGDFKSFVFQLDMMASQYKWDERQKVYRLGEALRDDALDYYVTLPESYRKSYKKLVDRMTSVFGVSNPPNSVRLEIASLKQTQDESLEEFARRTRKLVNAGYQVSSTEVINHVARDSFVKGVRDKTALIVALNRNPESLDEVYEYMREAVHNNKVAFGSVKPAIRNVGFSQTESSDDERTVRRRNRFDDHQGKQGGQDDQSFAKLEGMLARLLEGSSGKEERGEGRVSSPKRTALCFRCKSPDHFAKDCKEPKVCYRCKSPDHFANKCPEKDVTPGNRGCYRCKSPNHMLRNCPESTQTSRGSSSPRQGETASKETLSNS